METPPPPPRQKCSESAWEQRIVLYKSYQHQQHQTKLCGPRQDRDRNINNIRPSSVAPGRTWRETSTSDQALWPQAEKHQHQTKPCGPRQKNINNIRPSSVAPGRTGTETSATSDQALRPQAGQEQKHQQHQTKLCGPRQDRNRNINNIRPSSAAPGRTGTETSTTSDQALRPQAGQEQKHQQHQTKLCGPRQDRNRNINNIRPSSAAPSRTGTGQFYWDQQTSTRRRRSSNASQGLCNILLFLFLDSLRSSLSFFMVSGSVSSQYSLPSLISCSHLASSVSKWSDVWLNRSYSIPSKATSSRITCQHGAILL